MGNSSDPYNQNYVLLFLPLAMLTLGLLPTPALTEGLSCYECLSLSCDSGAVCESIKETMIKIFVPKSHFIHFDPRDPCPDTEAEVNSTRWANLSRECHRSDSICLVAPIEVETTFDGTKSGLKLEHSSVMKSIGHLRGCASRRKLKEKEETIIVRVRLTNDSTGNNNNGTNNQNEPPESNDNDSNSNHNQNHHQQNHDNHRKQKQQQQNSASSNDVVFHTATTNTKNNQFNSFSTDDDYVIMKIYSHDFFIDQGTENATRCYSTNCNIRIKPKRSGGGMSVNSEGISRIVYAAVIINYFLYDYVTPFH